MRFYSERLTITSEVDKVGLVALAEEITTIPEADWSPIGSPKKMWEIIGINSGAVGQDRELMQLRGEQHRDRTQERVPGVTNVMVAISSDILGEIVLQKIRADNLTRLQGSQQIW